MNRVFLKDICEVTCGQPAPQGDEYFSDQGLPFIRAGSLEPLLSGYKETSLELIPDNIAKQKNLRLFPKDTILFAKSGMSAKIGRVYRLKSSAYVVSHLAAIIPQKNISPAYLQRWFEYNPPSRLIPNDAYPSIRISEIGKIEINVPEFDIQIKIASILDNADALRQKRKQSIKLLDDFLRSTFLEMFGDPVKNDRKWPLKKFGEVCPTRLGKMLDIKKQTGKNKKYYLGNSSVLWGTFNLDNLQKMDFSNKEMDELHLKKGDLLICEGGEVGRTAIWKGDIPECYFQKAIHRGRPNLLTILPEYILFLMYFYAKYGGFKDYVSTATIAHLTGVKLKKMLIPLPPIALQNKFAAIVEQVESTKQIMQESLEQMNNCFDALMQRYFG